MHHIISVQSRVSVFLFMYYCNNIPGVFLPSTLQMKCCNVAAPAVALSTTTHYGLGKTFHNRGVTSLRAGQGARLMRLLMKHAGLRLHLI